MDRQFALSGVLNHVDQLCLEIHYNEQRGEAVRNIFELFETIEAAGLYAFSSEINLRTPSQRPRAWEYSFVRPEAMFV